MLRRTIGFIGIKMHYETMTKAYLSIKIEVKAMSLCSLNVTASLAS